MHYSGNAAFLGGNKILMQILYKVPCLVGLVIGNSNNEHSYWLLVCQLSDSYNFMFNVYCTVKTRLSVTDTVKRSWCSM